MTHEYITEARYRELLKRAEGNEQMQLGMRVRFRDFVFTDPMYDSYADYEGQVYIVSKFRWDDEYAENDYDHVFLKNLDGTPACGGCMVHSGDLESADKATGVASLDLFPPTHHFEHTVQPVSENHLLGADSWTRWLTDTFLGSH